MSKYLKVLATRSRKWAALLRSNRSLSRGQLLKRYIRKGIPNEYRCQVSPKLCEQRTWEIPHVYRHLLMNWNCYVAFKSKNTNLFYIRNFKKHFRTLKKVIYSVQIQKSITVSKYKVDSQMIQSADALIITEHSKELNFWIMERWKFIHF